MRRLLREKLMAWAVIIPGTLTTLVAIWYVILWMVNMSTMPDRVDNLEKSMNRIESKIDQLRNYDGIPVGKNSYITNMPMALTKKDNNE